MSKSRKQHLRDEEIIGAVQRALSHDERLGSEDPLEVSVLDGVVLLSGTVATAAERRAAELDARVPGVTSVENRVTVVTAITSDRELEENIAETIAKHSSLIRDVGAVVHHGQATLVGRVTDTAEAEEAIDATAEIPGVAAVEDETRRR